MTNGEKAEKLLNEKELAAYRKYAESAKPALSPSTAAQFYALFLQAYTCEDILNQNPALGLGIIVKARIEHDWDLQRDQHTKVLMESVGTMVKKATLESIQFAHDGMAVFHRLAGTRFKKYLQTGEERDLGDWKDMSFKTYREFVELIQKLTGQDVSKQQMSGEIRHVVESTVDDALPADRPVSSLEAAGLLKLLGGAS
jgi:hypothetical protein